jgi:hypothetical protein
MNSQDLKQFLLGIMQDLKDKKISYNEAFAQAKLANTILKVIIYEQVLIDSDVKVISKL